MEIPKERCQPFISKEERGDLERIACGVVDQLRKENIPIWKAKRALEVAKEFLECETLREE